MYNKENISTVILANSPWLTGKDFNISLLYPQPRFQLDALIKTLFAKQRRHAVVTGLRRVGKTTLLKHAIELLISEGISAKNIFYIPCDHPLIESAEIPNIIDAIETDFAPKGIWYLFIDEVHLTKDWNNWLKVIYDQNFNLRIVVTGSANPALVKGMSDSGLGRWYEINLPTMSFAEYCHILKIEKLKLPPFPFDTSQVTLADLYKYTELTKHLQPYFRRYMEEGGFPERCGAEDLDYMDKLLYNDVFVTMLRRDFFRYLKIRKLDAFTRLYRYMVEQTAQITNNSSVAKEIGHISKDTVSEYLDYFCNFGLLYKAEMFDKTGSKILKAQPKYHIADPALYAIFHRKPLGDKAATGRLVESVVYKHIADMAGDSVEGMGYLRDKKNSDKEIDVVYRYRNSFCYLEVKYQDKARPGKADAITSLAAINPHGNYLFLTKNASDVAIQKAENGSPVIILPAHSFLYWISQY